MPDFLDLEIIIKSKVPIVIIESFEELRLIELIKNIGQKNQLSVFVWSVTKGLTRVDSEYSTSERLTEEPDQVLKHIQKQHNSALYILCDLHPYLKDHPVNVRLLKEIALNHEQVPNTLLCVSHALELPAELKKYSAQFELTMPGEEQLHSIVREEALKWRHDNQGLKVQTNKEALDALVRNLRGLSRTDARRLARGAIADEGAITDSDIPKVNQARFQLLNMDGVLNYEFDTTKFNEVGGLSNLKAWLADRESVFLGNNNETLDLPKGILLLGVQGGGKSLAAKAVAGAWQLPLLRLDFGALYNKYFGESEKNLRESLAMAEAMSPCVLWMDELEKGISTSDNDNGISKRLLATLLTWMAERKEKVFLVATSNDISRLPPELIRKGRFDEIFFVDLPKKDVRQTIFDIHLEKREQSTKLLDTKALAVASDGFSGAEIEQVVVSACYSAVARKEPLTTTHLLEEIASTQPLSVIMEENISNLRQWALEKTVPAD